MAYWQTQYERGGFPIERASFAGFDLSVVFVGGEWQWLVRRDGNDLAEGASRAARAAKQQAEAVALRLGMLASSSAQRDQAAMPSPRLWRSPRAA